MVFFFLLRNGILLDIETNKLFANFLCYVMQFINL